MIEGDYLGIDPSGSIARPNTFGVSIVSGTGDNIGGTAPDRRNIISGNAGYGIDVYNFPAFGTLIEGNFIGTDTRGNASVANNAGGVELQGSSVTIGGVFAGTRNVISGNGEDGIFATTQAVIEGNFIGADSSGFSKLANAGDGIRLVARTTRSAGRAR